MSDKHEIELFIENKRDIDGIKSRVEKLMKEDLGLAHKLDLVIKQQEHMDEGFSHARETGFKTFEAVQKISTEIGEIKQSLKTQEEINSHHDTEIARVEKIAQSAHTDYKWLTRLLFLGVVSSLILTSIIWGFSKFFNF